MKTLLRALRYMRPYWGWQLAALASALVSIGTNFLWPFIIRFLIDHILWPHSGSDAHRLVLADRFALIVLGVSFTGALAGLARAYCFARVGERAAADLRRDLFRHMHRLPMAFFDRSKTGGIMSVVQNDVEALQGLYASTLVDVLTNVMTAGTAMGLMFWQSPRLAIVGLPVPIVFALALAAFGRPLRNAGRRVREETGHVQEVLQESIAGEREVKAFARAESEQSRFSVRVLGLVRARIRQAMLGAANGSVANIVATIGMVVVMVLCVRSVIARHMTAGSAVMFLNILEMLFGPAGVFVNLFAQIAGAVGAADRVFGFLDTPVEAELPGARAVRIEGRVRFEDVRFRYAEDGPDVLSDIDLDAAPGEVIALVGPSGSGKTTLVALLPRLYEATAGHVLIDDTDVRDIALASLRGSIAVVPQEPFLFGTTVFENIAFGRDGATRDEIVAAARAANAHDFIDALPDGYETQVGERGTRLSVGQKQRLAIARAILRDPRILILDEATSAQDSESERLVQDAMRRLMQGRTCFVIAHRLATVRSADRIVVLEAGRIAQIGRHSDLLSDPGLYARLHTLQSLPGGAAGSSSQL